MIELKQKISAAYSRLEENLESDGLRQMSTSALGVCLFMASALCLSPINEDFHWLDLLLGTVEVLKTCLPLQRYFFGSPRRSCKEPYLQAFRLYCT